MAREGGRAVDWLGWVIWLPMNYLDTVGAHTPIYPFIIPILLFYERGICCLALLDYYEEEFYFP